jgi:osmoprotectant transport system substrate-binding protein
MTHRTSRRARLTRRAGIPAAAALAATGLLSGCGLQTSGGFLPTAKLSGPVKDVKPLDGQTISVGSKNFSEQILLGKIAGILLQANGAKVTDLTNIPGSASARQAQVSGQIDLEWEYTGTAWISYLGHENGIPDREEQYAKVRDEDLKQNQLAWLKPAPMNNTYGFATTQATAKKLGISKLSELSKVPVKDRTFCVESEFASRNDGFQPMLKKYGVPLGTEVPRKNVKTLDTGAIYEATAQGQCNFGEIFTTDGRIKSLDLKVMEDDRKFFPAYNVAVVVRQPVLSKNPQIEQLLAPVAAKLDDKTLIELNAKIDVDGEDPAKVAMDWLVKEGFVQRG